MTSGQWLNCIAWGISAVLVLIMLRDFLGVERARRSKPPAAPEPPRSHDR